MFQKKNAALSTPAESNRVPLILRSVFKRHIVHPPRAFLHHHFASLVTEDQPLLLEPVAVKNDGDEKNDVFIRHLAEDENGLVEGVLFANHFLGDGKVKQPKAAQTKEVKTSTALNYQVALLNLPNTKTRNRRTHLEQYNPGYDKTNK